jgi:hypothetical protein
MTKHSVAVFRRDWRGWFLAISMAIVPVSQAAALVDLDPGITEVQFAWPEASGPVAGYYVYASVNGASDELIHAVPAPTSLPIPGSPGDTLIVSVSAFSEGGATGPQSSQSEAVRFTAASEPVPPEPEPDPIPEPDPEPDPEPVPERAAAPDN